MREDGISHEEAIEGEGTARRSRGANGGGGSGKPKRRPRPRGTTLPRSSRTESREVVSNLAKAAGLSTTIATKRPVVNSSDEHVRNTTSRAFAVVALAAGSVTKSPAAQAAAASAGSVGAGGSSTVAGTTSPTSPISASFVMGLSTGGGARSTGAATARRTPRHATYCHPSYGPSPVLARMEFSFLRYATFRPVGGPHFDAPRLVPVKMSGMPSSR